MPSRNVITASDLVLLNEKFEECPLVKEQQKSMIPVIKAAINHSHPNIRSRVCSVIVRNWGDCKGSQTARKAYFCQRYRTVEIMNSSVGDKVYADHTPPIKFLVQRMSENLTPLGDLLSISKRCLVTSEQHDSLTNYIKRRSPFDWSDEWSWYKELGLQVIDMKTGELVC